MAKEFSTKEARLLAEEHKKRLARLEKVAALPSILENEVKLAVRTLEIGNVLEHSIAAGLRDESRDATRTLETQRLISLLHQYRLSLPIADSSRYLLYQHKEAIQRNILFLQSSTGGIQWFFSGAKKRAAVQGAYEELKALSDGAYSDEFRSIIESADSIRTISEDDVWDDFTGRKNTYQSLLDQLVPRRYRTDAPVRLFSEILEAHDDLNAALSSFSPDEEVEKGRIQAAATKMAGSEVMNILRCVPVEELNRVRSGIRVKNLRENGYTTMADIYAASVYELASVYGISEDAAYTAKRTATRFADQSKDNVKIRLSSDNRTREASELVQAIYQYRKKAAMREELHTLVNDQKGKIQRARKKLDHVGNGLDWLFFSHEKRDSILDAYRELERLINGEYAKSVRRSIRALRAGEYGTVDDAWGDFVRNNISYFNILEEVVPGVLGNDDSLYGLPEELAREIQDEAFFPDGLLCTLRRYQEWGVKYILHQERVLLGDEMGLGKTVQAIASMVSLRNTGATHFMVVCPASVVTNWCREITKHSKLRVTKIHGSGRAVALRSWIATGGVAVTTYETTGSLRLKDQFRFDMLIVDEAHYIKNPLARRSIHVKELCAHTKRLLFMTGTALENKVDEMIALIDILRPDIASAIQSMAFMSTAPQFRERIAPVYYRRKREEVLTELPELIETREWCMLNAEERRIYEEDVLSKNYTAVRRVSWNVGDLKNSSKAARLMELIETAKQEDRKVLVFSFFLDTIGGISKLLGHRCYGPINGRIPPQRRQEIIDEFDKAPAGSVLLAQIQAGGTGLNIQSASVVVICEPQFKPSIENQAISRAYRMGQARNVLVYRLLCEGTVDERLMDLLDQKQAIFDAFADKSVAAAQSLEIDERSFGQLIQEEIDRINAQKDYNPETREPDVDMGE